MAIISPIRKVRALAAGMRAAAVVAVSWGILTAGACGGDGTETPEPSLAGSNETYPEGTVRMEIELLDVGLLKGHSYANANEGWTAASMRVEAEDHEGVSWPVIEPEFLGLGTAEASEFFEVTLQELPRGEQITVTTIVGFSDEAGQITERVAIDQWPP